MNIATTWTDLKALWSSNKLKFLLAALPFVLIAVLRLASYFVKLSANKAVSNAQSQDAKLSQEVSDLNSKSDALVADANKAASDTTPVDADWNVPKK